MVTLVQLATLLLFPLINKYKKFFVELIAIGMIYYSGQESRVLDIYNTEKTVDCCLLQSVHFG